VLIKGIDLDFKAPVLVQRKDTILIGAAALSLLVGTFAGRWLPSGLEWIAETAAVFVVVAVAIIIGRRNLMQLQRSEPKLREELLEARVAAQTKELRQSEERYRSVFDQAEEIIYTLSREGIITSLNPAFQRILGWSCEEWIGKPFIGLVPAEEAPNADALFAGLRRDGKLDLSRLVVIAKDGNRVSLELTIVEQVLQEKVVGYLGVARDVTQRDRAEERLRRSQRQLAEAQRAGNIGSFEHDLINNTLWWSDELYRICGLEPSAEPLPFNTFLDMVVEEDRPIVDQADRTITARGEHQWELRLRLADGTVKTVACTGKLVSDPSKGVMRVVGAVRDVTEQKHAEQLLHNSEERFRLATLATNDAIWDCDLATGLAWRSQAFSRLGYEGGSFEKGFDWWSDRLHPDEREGILQSQQEAIDSGQPGWSLEYQFRRADGKYAYVLDRGYIVRDPQYKPVRLLAAMMDMTERKQFVDQLEQAKRVTSLGRVAASIAHEFNNVLMGIQPNVEVIQRSSPSGLRTVTDNILQAVQRGKRVTDEILRFTRPAEPTLQCVSVQSFLDSWKAEISPLLGAPVELIIDPGSDPTYVNADALQLSQVFTNLALNAREAMQETGGKLTISARITNSFTSFPFGVVRSPDRFVHFVVRDEGCGIGSDRLGHIFEPLFTTKQEGIGLGLAVTYQIVTRHNGKIFVESEIGRGSSFHVFIPAASLLIEAPDAKANALLVPIRKLLLVEDEPAVAAGLAMLLEMEGVVVEKVYTGRDSIEAIERFSPDAVVLDIGLPDIDGVGVYLEIQRRWPELPVLFSSGHGDSAKLEAYLARPNVGFILKPYDFDAMRAALERLLNKHRSVSS
jgi:PAS domain S-box-containing protein